MVDFMDMNRQIIKINETTYRIEEGYVRWFVVIGDEKAAVIDTGIIGRGVLETVKSITDKDLILINTHGDMDHTSGNAEFESYYITEADYKGCGMAEKFPHSTPVFIDDGCVINLGNRELEIITVPGHTRGSVAIYDKNQRAMFAGDSVQTEIIYMFGNHRAPDVYREGLLKLMEWQSNMDSIYASHGVCELDADYISKVLNDWDDVNSGLYESEDVFLHGQNVKCFKAKNCGFYLDK